MAKRSMWDPFQVWVCTSSEAITALVLNSAAAITQQDKYEQALSNFETHFYCRNKTNYHSESLSRIPLFVLRLMNFLFTKTTQKGGEAPPPRSPWKAEELRTISDIKCTEYTKPITASWVVNLFSPIGPSTSVCPSVPSLNRCRWEDWLWFSNIELWSSRLVQVLKLKTESKVCVIQAVSARNALREVCKKSKWKFKMAFAIRRPT